MVHTEFLDTDTATIKYDHSLVLVQHILDTLKEPRWYDSRTNKIMQDLGQVVDAILGGYLDYRTGPGFADYTIKSTDLTRAMIDGQPYLVLKHFHVDVERIKPGIEDFLDESLEQLSIKHGTARTVFISSPWETMRWCEPTYGGPKFKITAYLLKGVCVDAELQRSERVAA